MASIIIVIMNAVFAWYMMNRIVQKREGNCWSLYVVFIFASIVSALFTQYATDGEMMTLAISAGCTVCEFAMLFIVGYWAVDDMWIQYARVLEVSNVKTIITIILTGFRKSVLRTTFTGLDASYEEALQFFVAYIIAIIVSEILLHCKLYGRIPYVIWKWFFIANYSLVILNMLRIVFWGKGLYETNVLTFAYFSGVIPPFVGIAVLSIYLIRILKNEVIELEKYYDKEYQRYQTEAKQYEKIRELRHDLANHLQVISVMEPQDKEKYFDELMEQLNGEY